MKGLEWLHEPGTPLEVQHVRMRWAARWQSQSQSANGQWPIESAVGSTQYKVRCTKSYILHLTSSHILHHLTSYILHILPLTACRHPALPIWTWTFEAPKPHPQHGGGSIEVLVSVVPGQDRSPQSPMAPKHQANGHGVRSRGGGGQRLGGSVSLTSLKNKNSKSAIQCPGCRLRAGGVAGARLGPA
jgi:hypothetical protein